MAGGDSSSWLVETAVHGWWRQLFMAGEESCSWLMLVLSWEAAVAPTGCGVWWGVAVSGSGQVCF